MTRENYALIDLHLHLDGSLSLESVKALAKMQNISLPERDDEILKILRVSEDCRDLNEYLEKFAFPGMLLQTKEGINEAVYRLCEELKEQGLIYAEIRFAPQFHLAKGLTQDEVVEAAIEGAKRSTFKCGLILCCMRGNDNRTQNLDTIRVAEKYLGDVVRSLDIAGAEAIFPTKDFEEIFTLAKEKNIPYTIHAGEADGPESVRDALRFGTKRLGHGVRSVEDDELVKTIAKEGIALELCPTSNIHTCIFEKMEDYPLRKLMEAGVKVTVNTDNMAVSGTTLPMEMEKLIKTFALTKEEQRIIARNSADASFASADTKRYLIEEIERIFA